jgi:hypothetical protein
VPAAAFVPLGAAAVWHYKSGHGAGVDGPGASISHQPININFGREYVLMLDLVQDLQRVRGQHPACLVSLVDPRFLQSNLRLHADSSWHLSYC